MSGTVEQRDAARARANIVRQHRAQVKEGLRAGRTNVEDVLHDPLLATMPVMDLLCAVPGIRKTRARILLAEFEQRPYAVLTVADLLPRDIELMTERLDQWVQRRTLTAA